MILDLDIYRSAQLLVKQHGEDAPIHAAMRADHSHYAPLALGGETVWQALRPSWLRPPHNARRGYAALTAPAHPRPPNPA